MVERWWSWWRSWWRCLRVRRRRRRERSDRWNLRFLCGRFVGRGALPSPGGRRWRGDGGCVRTRRPTAVRSSLSTRSRTRRTPGRGGRGWDRRRRRCGRYRRGGRSGRRRDLFPGGDLRRDDDGRDGPRGFRHVRGGTSGGDGGVVEVRGGVGGRRRRGGEEEEDEGRV